MTKQQWCAYLPYGVKASHKNGGRIYNVISIDMPRKGFDASVVITREPDGNGERAYLSEIVPVLKSISDYADINSESMNDMNTDLMIQIEISDFASNQKSLSNLSYSAYEELLRHHVNVFSLPESEYIKLNTIEK